MVQDHGVEVFTAVEEVDVDLQVVTVVRPEGRGAEGGDEERRLSGGRNERNRTGVGEGVEGERR